MSNVNLAAGTPEGQDRTLTVAHVTAPSAFGGLERVVACLTTALAQRSVRVILIAVVEPESDVPAWIPPLRSRGVTVEIVRVGARGYIAERHQVRRLLTQYGVQVVHTHGYRADIVHGSFGGHPGVASVSTVHGFTADGTRGRLYEWIQRRVLRRMRAVVAVSGPLVETLGGAGVGRDRIHCIVNALPDPGPDHPVLETTDARARLGLATNIPQIGWVGRLSPEKAPELLLDCLPLLQTSRANACFIGDGPSLPGCRAQAQTAGLSDRVHFSGAVPDAASLLRAFDVLALTSRTEGTPMVLLEAAAAGVPIVATDVGGIPDLLGEDGGVLVPAGNAAALAAALDDVLSRPQEAISRARGLSESLLLRSRSGDWIEAYKRLYTALVADELQV